jgi:GT2 family glycosyltransferase
LIPLSAVIPNRDGADLLRRTLPPLLRELPLDRHQVLVIDDASEDDSVAMLAREFPGVRVVALRENVGFGAACNLGFREAQHELVLLLNSDMEVTPGSLGVLLEHFSDPQVFAAGPEYRSTSADAPPPPRGPASVHAQVGAPAGGGVFRRAAFLDLGGFDPLYHPFYWEDLDLGWNAWAAGWRITHDTRCHFVHLESATIRKIYSERYVRRVRTRNRLLFGLKNLRSPGRLAHLVARTALGAVGDLVLRADPTRLLGVCATLSRLPACLGRRFGSPRRRPDREIIAESNCVWELLLRL